MKTTVSSKYQVVIPKAVRKQLGILPGQKVTVSATKDGKVLMEKAKATDIDSLINEYAGIARGAWGPDPVAWVRKQRDKEWD